MILNLTNRGSSPTVREGVFSCKARRDCKAQKALLFTLKA
jgi:hypothetical protein